MTFIQKKMLRIRYSSPECRAQQLKKKKSNTSSKNVSRFRCLSGKETNQYCTKEFNSRLNTENACYHSMQNLYFFTCTIYKHVTIPTKDVHDSNSLRARRLRVQKPLKVRFFPSVQTGQMLIQLPMQ